ncbi:MMPL domain-containing protein [Cytobacillus firmus]|nr:MMPL domain-containing protein [Cytobacillus firmus]
MFFIVLASVTLVPALFTLFGRKAFWPKVPKYGAETEVKHGPIARFVVNKPGLSGGIVGIFMLITAFNIFSLDYEFDTVKKFPEDLPSRVGYEIVEARYDKGELAPSTLLIVSDQKLAENDTAAISEKLQEYDEVASVRLSALSEDGKAAKMSVALSINPYSNEAISFMKDLRDDTPELLEEIGVEAESYYSGVTPKIVDEQDVNSDDIMKIVLLETVLILALLFALTKSIRMPIYMIATILLSFVSALGLGIFLVDVLFGFEAISSRVPVYSFIFLVALGID